MLNNKYHKKQEESSISDKVLDTANIGFTLLFGSIATGCFYKGYTDIKSGDLESGVHNINIGLLSSMGVAVNLKCLYDSLIKRNEAEVKSNLY